MVWEGCPADETWNNAYAVKISGPLSNQKAIAGFFQAAENVKSIVTPTTTQAPTLTGPTYGLFLGYQTRTIPVGAGPPLLPVGQSATLWFDEVIATKGFNIEPSIDYCNEKSAKFGTGMGTPRKSYPPYPTTAGPTYFVGDNICKWVPAPTSGAGSLSCMASPTSVPCTPAYRFGLPCYDSYEDSFVQPLANCTWQKN